MKKKSFEKYPQFIKEFNIIFDKTDKLLIQVKFKKNFLV